MELFVVKNGYILERIGSDFGNEPDGGCRERFGESCGTKVFEGGQVLFLEQ